MNSVVGKPSPFQYVPRISTGSVHPEPSGEANEKGGSGADDTSSTEILTHFFSDIGATRQLLDSYKKWTVKCGPFRYLYLIFDDILHWKKAELSLLVIVLWSWICIYPRVSIPVVVISATMGAWYFSLLMKHGVIDVFTNASPMFQFEDINANLWFNQLAINYWCRGYDKVKLLVETEPVFLARQVAPVATSAFIVLLLLPIHIVLLVLINGPLLWFSPYTSTILYSTRLNRMFPQCYHHEKEAVRTRTFEVYENQRWWLGNWTDKGLSIGTSTVHPWSDITGHVLINKTDIIAPEGSVWVNLWHVDIRGWMYGSNFSDEESAYHTEQRSSDFVRRRKWIRSAETKL